MEKFDLTQEQIAKQVGKSRSAVANTLRLLDLPDSIAEMVKEGALSAGHARTLLPLEDPEEMEMAANRIIARSLSVRDAEALVKRLLSMADETDQVEIDSEKGLEKLTRIHMKELENRARATLSRRVRITNTGKKKTVELTFEDNEDLESLLKALCGQDFFADEAF
jgi:ParB family chromosome partitioning protein